MLSQLDVDVEYSTSEILWAIAADINSSAPTNPKSGRSPQCFVSIVMIFWVAFAILPFGSVVKHVAVLPPLKVRSYRQPSISLPWAFTSLAAPLAIPVRHFTWAEFCCCAGAAGATTRTPSEATPRMATASNPLSRVFTAMSLTPPPSACPPSYPPKRGWEHVSLAGVTSSPGRRSTWSRSEFRPPTLCGR